MNRTDEILALIQTGTLSYEEIGKRFNLSKQRVHQIACRHGIFRPKLQRVEKVPIRRPHPLKGVTGESHPAYRGDNVTPETGRVRARKLYPKLGKCERCRIKPALDRHHKDENPLNNARENLEFLCAICHRLAHS